MAGSMQIKSFSGGMNKDLSYSILPENTYIHAENFKLITSEGATGFTLENAEGNTLFTDFQYITGMTNYDYIVGTCFVKPYLIVFTSTAFANVEPGDGDAVSKIIRFVIDKDVVQDSDLLYTDEGGTKGYLNFSVSNPIKAVGYYESAEVVKIYWVDGYNEARYLNIVGLGINSMTKDKFSLVPDFPDVSFIGDTRVIFDGLVSGNLKASTVQYTYQYYKKNGASTKFAPLSAPVIIPFTSDKVSYQQYRGGEAEEETGNGCRLKIYVPASKEYNRLRLVALDFYGALDVPVVRVFKEVTLNTSDTTTEYYFTDIGETINEIVYEDFLVYGETTYSAKDVETKDSMLFMANIEETAFDVDFDARAYRHDYNGIARLYSADLSTYIQVNDGAGGNYYDFTEVPETHDCINRYNNPDNDDSVITYKAIYQKNGSTIGAEGENIKIRFTYTGKVIDQNPLSNPANPTPATGAALSYPDNATYLRSLQRDDVYRIGIVFFNNKMQPSKVKWSCDIRTPNNYYSGSGSMQSAIAYTQDIVTSDPDATYAVVMGISVTLKTALPEGVHAWQVVMVPRRFEDRSVLFNALLQTPAINTDAATYYHPDSDETTTVDGGSNVIASLTTVDCLSGMADHEPRLAILISPEINFNQNIVYQSGDFLQYTGYYLYEEGVYDITTYDAGVIYHKLGPFWGDGENHESGHRRTINDFVIVPQNADSNVRTQIDTYSYSNYAKTTANPPRFLGLHGTCGVAALSSDLSIPDMSSKEKVAAVAYRRNVFTSQYGGIDYYARQYSEYIGIGKLQYSFGTVDIYEGDTYIDYFWYLKQARDLAYGDGSFYASLLFPVESSIASSLQHSKTYMQYGTLNSTLMRETSGLFETEVDGENISFDQPKDLYQYNSVYSIQGIGKKYFSKLFDESNIEYFPMRIRNSDIKINGEIQDSFTIFRANNFIDVEGRYGEINNLEFLRNTLFFWQDFAFGTLAVNERALIQDNNPGVLALGSGGVLDRYDYISTSTGNVNENGIVKTNTGLYWVDNNKNEFIRFREGEQSVAKSLGLQSWINSTGKIGHVIGTYDNKYNDVVFTVTFSDSLFRHTIAGHYGSSFTFVNDRGLLGDFNIKIDGRFDGKNTRRNVATIEGPAAGDVLLERDPYTRSISGDGIFYAAFLTPGDKTYTISLNEQLDKFVSFHSFKPMMYIQCDKEYMSVPENYNDIYHHNDKDANRGQYYGITYDSVITTVFNKDYPYTKVFDNIKWLSESKDSDKINQFKDTFSEVSFYNDYQHTGNRSLYYQHDPAVGTLPIPISRRERTWSLQIPRNIVDQAVELNPDITDPANWDATQEFKDRMRDKYLIGNFVYDNTANNIFSVPFISTTYRRSFR